MHFLPWGSIEKIYMNPALQKTLSFILLIVVGLLLKKKIPQKAQLGGIKTLIFECRITCDDFYCLVEGKG